MYLFFLLFVFVFPYCHVCFWQGKGLTRGFLVCDVFCVFVTFPHGVLGQVRYLIVSIPDLCFFLSFILTCAVVELLRPDLHHRTENLPQQSFMNTHKN